MTDKKVAHHRLEYLLLRGAIAEMPEDAQKRVLATAALIEESVKQSGEFGPVALSLVATKLLSEQEAAQ